MIDRINIIVNNLYNSQLCYYVSKELNLIRKNFPNIDCIVFIEEPSPFTITPFFGIMNIAEVYDQPGLTIATSLSTAKRLIACWAPQHKVFYSWDLFWLRGRQKVYEPYFHIYNGEYDVVARNTEHKTIIENNFNVKVKGIVENFNISEFIRLYDTNTGDQECQKNLILTS